MSTIKSFAVGNGDMFYIEHNGQNFTIIDCYLVEENERIILDEIEPIARAKGIHRVISTHPDDDHYRGIEKLEARIGIPNFYMVANKVEKSTWTASFEKYCELRDGAKACALRKGLKRRWLNEEGEGRDQSGIEVLWPDLGNAEFKQALAAAEAGDATANNISAILKYRLVEGVTAMWMGDLEHDFLQSIENDFDTSPVDVVFAPHHGRRTGRIPGSILQKLRPKIIVIGEAASEHLDYYQNYNTITQNRAGDVILECEAGKVHVFTSKEYERDFLNYEYRRRGGSWYVGSFDTHR